MNGAVEAIVHPRAERLEDPAPAVARRAAADPQHDVADPGVQHGHEDLARPARRSAEGIPIAGREPGQPRGTCQLDDGTLAIEGAEPPGRHRPSDRVRRFDRLPGPATRGGDGLERALPAVGERCQHDLVLTTNPPPAVGKCLGHLDRGQGSLE